MSRFIRLSVVLCVFSVLACNSAGDPDNVGTSDVCLPVDYKQNVFYFPCVEEEFGNSLSQFIGNHEELSLITMTADGTAVEGFTAGYFVVFSFKPR